MIAHEHATKISDSAGVTLADREGARFDIVRIGGIEYRDDSRIIELRHGCLSMRRSWRQSEPTYQCHHGSSGQNAGLQLHYENLHLGSSMKSLPPDRYPRLHNKSMFTLTYYVNGISFKADD
jgi:hypothetical protein